ncbi:MAG: dTMP kinase [Acetobacteraceae bacterium]|nr:dTMP kinase [Acetobacteraceae bacterium]
MPDGRLIVLEGGEGAGKSTQARLLADALCALGFPVLRTREPGGSPGAEFLRSALLSGEIDWSPRAETMLHVAARMEHVAKTIRPAIEAGSWVVCDRFHDSTMAYQGHGLDVDRGMIAALGSMVGITPDLTIVLDVPREAALTRLRQRGAPDDRYERLNEAFHLRVNEGFRAIAAEPRHVLVDASGDIAAVHAAIMAAIHDLIRSVRGP